MTQQPTHHISVDAGLQQGAVEALDCRCSVSVGTSLDNDVVILLPPSRTGDGLRFTLCQKTAAVLQLTVLDGEATVDDQPLAATESTNMRATGKVQWNGIELSVSRCTGEHLPEAPPQRNRVIARVTEFLNNTLQTRHLTDRTSYQMSLLAMATGSVLLFYAIAPDHLRFWQSTDLPPPLEQQVANLELDNVKVEFDASGAADRIVGHVQSRSEWMTLSSLVREQSAGQVDLNVQIDEEFADDIDDIFRVHGAEAEIQVTGPGRASVNSNTSEATLAQIREALERDIPSLVELDIENTPPKAPPPRVRSDPGKTVETIVSGEPAYVLTRDQSRYFVGSTLPSGHTITDITDGEVTVLLDGVKSTLQF
ncbi:MAG: hypothetical protein CSB44_01305 [Gammaproteobacteria bacterium]|nr:MAG: hypothetical protein CSB44_01305 [Gammaproteobacteria bacterium]